MARRTWTFAYIYLIWVNEQLVFDVAQREGLGKRGERQQCHMG